MYIIKIIHSSRFTSCVMFTMQCSLFSSLWSKKTSFCLFLKLWVRYIVKLTSVGIAAFEGYIQWKIPHKIAFIILHGYLRDAFFHALFIRFNNIAKFSLFMHMQLFIHFLCTKKINNSPRKLSNHCQKPSCIYSRHRLPQKSEHFQFSPWQSSEKWKG